MRDSGMVRVSIGWRPAGFSRNSDTSMSPKKVSTSVRGIGVAVSTSTSTASPFCVSASRWCTPKRCCSSTMAEAKIAEGDLLLKQRMGAEQQIDVAERQAIEDFGCARRRARGPVRMATCRPAASAKRRDGLEMLAGEDFGRRHEGGLASGFDHGRGGEQRHHGLAGADIALQQPQHALRQSEIVDDVVERLLLRMGERVRQRLEDARAQAAFAGVAAAGLAAHMRAHQRQRQLAGEQFVIGKPRPGKAFRMDVVRRRRAGAGDAARRRRRGSARARPRPRPAIPAAPAGA